MAVETNPNSKSSNAGGGRRFLVGSNVAMTIALVIAIVGVLQYFAYRYPAKADMTTSGVNSLSDGTTSLLRGLETPVKLTSLYFETDLEDEDQPRYRRTVDDLLGLYASTNRSKITTDWVNPISGSEHEKLQRLLTEVREKPKFKEEISAYRARLDRFQSELFDRMTKLVTDELAVLAGLGGGMQDQGVQRAIGPVEELLNTWTRELEQTRSELDGLLPKDNPQEAAAVRELKTLYRDFSKSLNDISAHGRNVLKNVPNMPEPQAAFLRDAGSRYAPLVASVEEEKTKLDELKPLKVEDVLRELTPNGNPILVQTPTDAKIVDFSSVWPPMDQSGGSRRAAFKDRAFKGEEKVTSAILRATHKEQTAVLFVRYGGPPLFFGGFMPGQPQAPLAAMKQQLEDANFVVEEWDLKSKDTPPDIDPKPTKTIFVVLKPTPPEQKMPGQPSQDPPFGENHRKTLMTAMGDNPKALFIAGWAPGPFGPVPSTYEFGEYLKTTWGIGVDTSALLIETVSTKPGQYGVARRDWMSMRDIQLANHDITRGALGQRVALPWSAPLNLASPPPAGVELVALAAQPKKDGVWGVKNLQAYEDQQTTQGFLSRVESDLEGPFDLAAAAKKGDAKVVVVSSREFASDGVAFASEMAMTSQGITLRSRNPGNVTLFINALHWLNDNVQFMNIGRPIDAAILTIPETSTVRAVQALTIFVWPMLALVSGGVAYWMRRR